MKDNEQLPLNIHVNTGKPTPMPATRAKTNLRTQQGCQLRLLRAAHCLTNTFNTHTLTNAHLQYARRRMWWLIRSLRRLSCSEPTCSSSGTTHGMDTEHVLVKPPNLHCCL